MPIKRVDITSKAKGSALISALFIMTIVAIVATAMSTRLQLDIYRTRLVINNDKLYLASEAVAFWAMDQLLNNNLSFKSLDNKGRILDFPSKLQSIYPAVVVKGALYDLQALFNLNNLQNKTYQPLFYGLLEQILPKSEALTRKKIVDATANWVTTQYQTTNGFDEWFLHYTSHNPAYFPSHQPMQSVSEFRLVFGVTPKLYQQILPFITTLPEITPINLMTAPKIVLRSLGKGLSDSQAEEIIKFRAKKRPVDLFAILPAFVEKYSIPIEQVMVESSYFLSIATTSIDDLNLTNYTIIKRTKDVKGKISIKILSVRLNAQ